MAHGVSNSLLLPYVMKWNKIACMEKLSDIAEALGEKVDGLNRDQAAEAAIEAMTRLCRYVEIPQSLREFNIRGRPFCSSLLLSRVRFCSS